MKKPAILPLSARKKPVQSRSTVTVDAIFEATIQVLLEVGPAGLPDRLTTTRIARRAGVSVGSLYQYFPNKQAVLHALLETHLLKVVAALERSCAQQHHQPVATMAREVVNAFLDAKLEQAEASVALYAVAASVNVNIFMPQLRRRAMAALSGMLATAQDVSFHDLQSTSATLYAAMTGTTRSVLEAGATPRMVQSLRKQLCVLCAAYLAAAGAPAVPISPAFVSSAAVNPTLEHRS